MTTRPDLDRLIGSFLEEGPDQLADRSYDAVRARIDRTRQRAIVGPWREPRMSNMAKLVVAAAAVVVLAIIGFKLLPNPGGVGGPNATPPPTLAPSPSPTTAAAVFPPSGALALGRHAMTLNGVPLTINVSTSGWVSNGSFGIDRSTGITPEGAGFIFWSDATPVGVFSDPCKAVRGPAIGSSAADLARAVSTLPGTDLVSGPTDVTVGGHPAKQVVVTVREDVGCAPDHFMMWYAPRADLERYATELGSTVRAWIVDVNGTLVWFDGETFKGAGPEPGQKLQAIVDSIQFE